MTSRTARAWSCEAQNTKVFWCWSIIPMNRLTRYASRALISMILLKSRSSYSRPGSNAPSTTMDEYLYTSDDMVVEGAVEPGRLYEERDFNKIIEIKAREAYRVSLFMGMIDQREKTLVFCASQLHALAVRDLINQMKTSRDPNYCVRVTANDGAS